MIVYLFSEFLEVQAGDQKDNADGYEKEHPPNGVVAVSFEHVRIVDQ